MTETTAGILGFLGNLFALFLNILQDVWRNDTMNEEIKMIVFAIYLVIFVVILILTYAIFRYVLGLIASAIASLFKYTTESLSNPESIPYVAAVVLLKSVPWYFMVLLIILIFCGLLALVTGGGAWLESFKYILGATVGSLIGVINKKEQIEFEHEAFQKLIREPRTNEIELDKSKETSDQKKQIEE